MALDEDEALPRRPARLERINLDPLGLAELTSYIEELRAEIVRTEAEMARKSHLRGAADAFFRRP